MKALDIGPSLCVKLLEASRQQRPWQGKMQEQIDIEKDTPLTEEYGAVISTGDGKRVNVESLEGVDGLIGALGEKALRSIQEPSIEFPDHNALVDGVFNPTVTMANESRCPTPRLSELLVQ